MHQLLLCPGNMVLIGVPYGAGYRMGIGYTMAVQGGCRVAQGVQDGFGEYGVVL